MRLFCTEFDSADEVFVGDAGAVEQIDAPAIRRIRQCLHLGDEWRDHDAEKRQSWKKSSSIFWY